MAPPLSETELKKLAHDACSTALSDATSYKHESTAKWNDTIVSTLLQSLVSSTSSTSTSSTSTTSTPTQTTSTPSPPFKFMINSTIMQHQSSTDAPGAKRGMHTAACAYWDNERDGMWSYKYEGKGMDVVVMVMWVAL
ncbi:hypothetical protein EJ08DRAFT_702013 [Tothia fuscella]|uniref:Dynein light chain n=1 Tax=Tothia fuscella TaxID=1048955 RepID=A0A9P4NHC5_9PEZI|nr:hypothetical protein EJ08DRAFT_702013 [Tothia fuscella]